MKIAEVDAVASDLRWICNLQIVGAKKLKARREMLVGAKLLSGLYCMYVLVDLRLRERTRG